MADRKISDLTALTTPASGDYLPIVDISEVAAASKNKRITIEELMRGAPDGTAAAPSIAFESDPNTGIYSPGADQLAISTNGTGRLFVDASGNVGLGTSSPNERFSVEVNGTPNRAIEIYNGDTILSDGELVHAIRFTQNDASFPNTTHASIETVTAGSTGLLNMVFKARDNTEYMRIDTQGRVGIGTTSPATTLDVNGDVTITDKIIHGGDTNTAIRFPAADTVSVETAGSERARIDSSGRLGLGTSSPGQKLEVAGGNIKLAGNTSQPFTNFWGAGDNSAFLLPYGFLGSHGAFAVSLYCNGYRDSSPGFTYLGVNGNTTTACGIDLEPDGDIIIRSGTASGTTLPARMFINSSGNVGIGTTSPDVGLHYQGDQPKLRIESSNELATTSGTEEIGRLEWEGFRNTNFNAAASIRARQDGTWSTTTAWFSPTALEFYTQDNTGVEVTSPRLTIDSTGNVGIGTTSPGSALEINAAAATSPFIAKINTSEAARIDSSGRLLVGTSTARAFDSASATLTPLNQIESTGSEAAFSVTRNNNTTLGPSIFLGKSRGAAIGGVTVVASGDQLGSLVFEGTDGAKLVEGALIRAEVDGTPGTNDMPGRLVFSTTADGAASPTERMRIDSAGVLQVADAGNITVGTTTGTKIGTATTQKIGFFDATPVVQPTAVADATDAVDVITQLNALLTRMRNLGLIAT
jgi:hypothetical protein